jgi:site-specific DNA recombinase
LLTLAQRAISPSPMLIRCALYCRFSDEMQSPRSTADQERECRTYAERQGWEVVLVERDDAVRAGAAAGRVGYQRLLSAAKSRTFDVLLVEEVSRFSRDFLGGLTALADLRKERVQLADTKSGILDLNTAHGQLQVAFNLVSSQQETQRLGERSKRGLKGKVIDGYSAGGQPAYGYARAPVFSTTQVDVDGRPLRVGVRFEPHPVEAAILKRIFTMFDAGMSKHGTATTLNREGIPSRRAGGTRRGRPNSGTWSTASIKRILENPIYLGERIWDRTSRKGEKSDFTGKKQQKVNPESSWTRVKQYAPPLIDEELWQRVQHRLKADAQRYRKLHTANENKRYLLSGLIRCAGCGASFVIGAHRGRPPTPHYRCGFHAARGRTVCSNSIAISQVALEVRVKDLLEVIVKDPRQLELLVADHNRRISTTNEGQLTVVHTLQARERAAAEERDRLVSAIAMGTGAARALVAEVEKRESELSALAARIAEAEALVQPLLRPRAGSVADYKSGSATLFTGDFTRDRDLLERVLDGVLVYADGSLVARFREASLFEPMRFAHLSLDPKRKNGALPVARTAALKEFQAQRADIARVAGKKALESLEMDVEEDADGQPAFIMMTKGAVTRTFSGGPAPRRPDEIALASPGGFSRCGYVEPAANRRVSARARLRDALRRLSAEPQARARTATWPPAGRLSSQWLLPGRGVTYRTAVRTSSPSSQYPPRSRLRT